MIIAFDLDDTICYMPEEYHGKLREFPIRYNFCEPYDDVVDGVNSLYEQGHYIKIYTARGMGIFKGDVVKVYNELFELTRDQLKRWGVNYHELVFGKTHYDILIDDKAINASEWEKVYEIIEKGFQND